MKVKFKFDFLGFKIENTVEYPNNITDKEIEENLKSWLLNNISGFAYAQKIDNN